MAVPLLFLPENSKELPVGSPHLKIFRQYSEARLDLPNRNEDETAETKGSGKISFKNPPKIRGIFANAC